MEYVTHLYKSLDLLTTVDILSVILFIFLFPKMTGSEKWLGATVILYGMVDISAYILALNNFYNQWVYSIMLIPQLLLVVFGLTVTLKNMKLKNLMRVFSIILSVLHVLNMIGGQGYHALCTDTYLPACALMAAAAFFCLRDQFDKTDKPVFSAFITWFAFATMIDNAGALPVLSTLGWPSLYADKSLLFLWDIVQALYVAWFLINITGILWTKTTLRSVLRFQ